MKICLFGGTFDPPHIGHLLLAQTIFEEESFDKVLFIPAYQPPHKNNISPVEDRLKTIFKRLGIKTSKPDFNVYETKKKSYDADITDNSGNRFHCKSQCVESANKYGKSYILQYGGNGMGHVDKLFRNVTNRDFLIPCLVDVENMEVIIFGCIKIETIMKKDLIKMEESMLF